MVAGGISWAVLALPLLGVGLWLLVAGLRGRRINDDPLCRRCGYNLTGRPVGSERCSECGADISRADAIRIGQRRRRPLAIAFGVVLLLPALLLMLASARVFSEVRWVQFAPHFYLLRQAKAATTAGPELAELQRRLTGGKLSDEQIWAGVEAALSIQGDAKRAWVVPWGDFVESARAAGKVSDAQWARYLTQAPVLSLSVRPQVRRGDNLPIRIHESGRCGSGSIGYTMRAMGYDTPLIVERDRHGHGSWGGSLSASGSGTMGTSIRLDPAKVAAAPEGNQPLRVKMVLEISGQRNQVELSGSWRLVAADAPTVKAIDDPSVRAAVEKAVTVEEILRDKQEYVHTQVRFKSVPVPLAHRVVARAEGREWEIGEVYVSRGGSTGWSTGREAKGLHAEMVDVILRPDPKVALGTVDMTEYWNGEIVIPNVKVKKRE